MNWFTRLFKKGRNYRIILQCPICDKPYKKKGAQKTCGSHNCKLLYKRGMADARRNEGADAEYEAFMSDRSGDITNDRVVLTPDTSTYVFTSTVLPSTTPPEYQAYLQGTLDPRD